jgi:hypothetical protein
MVFFGGAVSNVVVFGPLVQIVIDSRVVEWPFGVPVMEYRDIDLHLPSAASSDVGSQSRESDVRVCNLVWEELRSQFRPRYWMRRYGAVLATKPWKCG